MRDIIIYVPHRKFFIEKVFIVSPEYQRPAETVPIKYVYCDEEVKDIFSYARYFPSLERYLLDFVSQNYFWDNLKRVKPVGEEVVRDDFRIDLISYKWFGSHEYWWIILLYNGVMVEELREGMRLLIPNPSDIHYLFVDTKVKARLER